ncbi:DNA primase [Clostridia bacterium OttesenSCG-928-F22]|nr:DNA primase [Clostridia bacterium OttesenSCG-928-F22]
MISFPEEWLNELRQNNDIVDVVGEYVSLKPNGSRHWGCCPFHSEKTPSFNVQEDKQLFYCFGCHKGGDVIRFIMDVERLTFPESVDFLAKRAGMEVPVRESGEEAVRLKQKRDRLYMALKQAARFFNSNLYAKEGADALAYLHKRGIADATIKRFGLGYSLDSWDALITHLQKEGFSEEELVQANLAARGKKKGYDFFRNRVMFPIIDHYGNVIGFGGRVMDDSMPKYINTSDTAVFNKRRNLYGLNYINKRTNNLKLIMVEGYMDVISLYQRGRVAAIATLGTALAKEQARLIKRYTHDVYIAYDGDTAGQAATLRGLDILREEEINVKVVEFPNKEDPDEFITKHGREAFYQAVEKAAPLMEYKLKALAREFNLSDAEEKMKYTMAATKLIGELRNPVEREQYIRYLQTATGYTMEALIAQLNQSMGVEIKKNKQENIRNDNKQEEVSLKNLDKARGILLVTMARSRKDLQRVLAHNLPVFEEGLTKRIADAVLALKQQEYSYVDVVAKLQEEDVPKATEIFNQYTASDSDEELSDCVQLLNKDTLEKRIKQLANEAKQETDRARQMELLQEIQKLTVELKG